MENSTKKKQTLHISLKLIDDNNPGEPITVNVTYSGQTRDLMYDVFDSLEYMLEDNENVSFDPFCNEEANR